MRAEVLALEALLGNFIFICRLDLLFYNICCNMAEVLLSYQFLRLEGNLDVTESAGGRVLVSTFAGGNILVNHLVDSPGVAREVVGDGSASASHDVGRV